MKDETTTTVELIKGGTFKIQESEILETYFSKTLKGIIIKMGDGTKITVADTEINRNIWKPQINRLS